MKRYFWLGATTIMTACSNQPPVNPNKPSYATHRDQVRPSPIQFPAEIDPPPVPAPGSEGPGLQTTEPPVMPPPKDDSKESR